MHSPPAPTPRHLLAIEHDAGVRQLFHDALTGDRYQVSIMDYVEKTFAAVVRLAPDLILYDYLIDGAYDGWAFLQRLRTDHQTQAIPMIVCSAAVLEVQTMTTQFATLQVPVLLKPFTLNTLEATIAAALHGRRIVLPAGSDSAVTT